MQRTINIPKFLHEVHGEKARITDVMAAHAFAITVTVFTLYWSTGTELSTFKMILLGILAYDLSGGVLANFSKGTSDHYAASARARRNFLLLHVLQPTMMVYIFQGNDLMLVGLGLYIVLGSSLVNAQQTAIQQLRLGALISLSGITLLFIPALPLSTIQQLLLVFFMLKLPLAFAVQWYKLGSAGRETLQYEA